MLTLLTYELKVAVLLAAFYLIYKAVLSRDTFHLFNRMILVGAALVSFALPFCVITIHKTLESGNGVATVQAANPMLTEAVPEAVTAGAPWWQYALVCLYFTGIGAMLLRMAMELVKVRKIIRKGTITDLEGGIRISIQENDVPPFSWMNWIVMSRGDYESANSYILEHEKAHIRLGHSKYVLLMDLLSSMQWFNPAMWLLRSDLFEIYEFEADDAVLRNGADIKEYQYSLIRKAVSASGYSITNSFNHSILKKRITMMSKSKCPKLSLSKALCFLPVIAAALTVNAKTVYTCKVSDNPVSAQQDSLVQFTPITEESPYLYIIDGKMVTYQEWRAYDPDDFSHVESLICEPGEGYLDKEVKQIFICTTKKNQDLIRAEYPSSDVKNAVTIVSADGSPLFIVHGKEMSKEDVEKFDPEEIYSIVVAKDEITRSRFGEKGKNGIVLIRLKED